VLSGENNRMLYRGGCHCCPESMLSRRPGFSALF
jgi:hypothetical protein